MGTEKLYLQNSYLIEFKATVEEIVKINDQEAVILDKTAFYPTSGGQMHDKGEIGEAHVVNVEIKEGEILHFVEGKVTKSPIIARVDWQRRFDFMQQHTGFHILAQSFLRITGSETASSHLGEEYSTIDVQIDNIDWQTIEKVEAMANSVIWENRNVRSYFVEDKDLSSLKLRKYSVAERPIRLVDIEGYDLDPCGGTHVRRTGEVGIVKIIYFEKVRNYLRFTFVAGNRAQKDYQKKATILCKLGAVFSTGQDDLVYASQKALISAKTNLKSAERMQKRLMELEVEQLIAEAKMNNSIVVREFEDDGATYMKRLASMALKRESLTLIFGHRAESATIILATSQPKVDLYYVFSEVKQLFAGRGGGRKDFIQAGGGNTGNLSTVLTQAERLVRQQFLDHA